ATTARARAPACFRTGCCKAPARPRGFRLRQLRSATTHRRTPEFLRPAATSARQRLGKVRAMCKVAERLAARPLAHETPEQIVECRENGHLIDVLARQPVEPQSFRITAQEQVVTSRRLSDQRNLGKVGSRATVRATGDT